jgi:hypothetical protein
MGDWMGPRDGLEDAEKPAPTEIVDDLRMVFLSPHDKFIASIS